MQTSAHTGIPAAAQAPGLTLDDDRAGSPRFWLHRAVEADGHAQELRRLHLQHVRRYHKLGKPPSPTADALWNGYWELKEQRDAAIKAATELGCLLHLWHVTTKVAA